MVWVDPMQKWKECGREEGRNRLLGRAEIFGSPMRVEAIRVTESDDGQQVAAELAYEYDLNWLFLLCGYRHRQLRGRSRPFRTVEFKGGRYVVFFTPHLQ